MLELNKPILLLFSLLIVVVLVSTCVTLVLYFYEGNRTGWTFRERLKVMRVVLEEIYNNEYPNIFQRIFFFIQFKLGWTKLVLLIIVLLLILIANTYIEIF